MPVTVNTFSQADLKNKFQCPLKDLLITANKKWPEIQHLVCVQLICTA